MKPATKEEIWEDLEESGFAVGLRLPISVKPIITEDIDENKTQLYLLTLDEIPALQGLLYTLQTSVITLENEKDLEKCQ